MLVAIGQQSPLDGAFRLMVALAMELLADIIVWSIMEVEGCEFDRADPTSRCAPQLKIYALPQTRCPRLLRARAFCG